LSCRAALLTVTFALLACRSRGPDANYQPAFTIYQQLYATELDDAYGDARMNDVVALLRKVDPRSGDAERATALLGTIERGKEAFAQQQAEREKRSAAITQSATAPQFEINPSKILAANEPDAGQQVQDPFGPGASVADLNASHGGCLQDNEPFNEQGTGVSGTVYRVAPSDSCRSKLPGLSGQIVLVVGGKIYRRMADPRPPPPPAPAATARPAPAASASAQPPPR
jgi:hypothetical protein